MEDPLVSVAGKSKLHAQVPKHSRDPQQTLILQVVKS
jgi:hypothetical protein